MKADPGIGGVWVAMVTPWDLGKGAPRIGAVGELIARFADAGVHGLFVLGTTGEGTLLSPRERMAFAEAVASRAEGKLPVIVHAGHDSTPVVIELSRHARGIGAAAVAVAPPTRYRLDPEELYAHYARVAESLGDFPLLLYDIPATTGNPLGGELLSRLRDAFPNVVGAKVSRGDWDGMRGYLARAAGAAILVGNDEMIWPGIAMGAAGLVSSLANLFPDLYVRLFDACIAGDLIRARELQRWVWRLAEICHRASPLAYVKRGLAVLGIDVGEPLPPLRDLSAAEAAALERDLRAFREEWNRVFRGGGDS